MKALRRSMKGDKNDNKLSHISITPKSAIAIIPPKLIIRANYDYEAQGPDELSFQKGDFFHVLSRENSDDWYEACNPTKAEMRGLVPAQYFARIGKNERDSGKITSPLEAMSVKEPAHDSGFSDASGAAPAVSRASPSRLSHPGGKRTMGSVLARLEHPFEADNSRPEHDEISRDVGDMVLIVAVSTPEWVVAKPAGPKGGGHGLLPLGFVTLLDMRTHTPLQGDPMDIIRRELVPPVDVWKQATAAYKNSCIELGKIGVQSNPQQPGMQQQMDRLSLQNRSNGRLGHRESQARNQGPQYFKDPVTEETEERNKRFPLRLQMQNYARHFTPPSSACIHASVTEVSYEEDDHVFILLVAFEDGNEYELCRVYENFFKFQVLLKDSFPAEAGDNLGNNRSLPFMPGPLPAGDTLTEAISVKRRDNLDDYVRQLLQQPNNISRSLLVTTFFSPQHQFDRFLGKAVPQNQAAMYPPQSQRSSYGSPEAATNSRQSSRGDNSGGYNGLQSPSNNQPYGHAVSKDGGSQQQYDDPANTHFSHNSQSSQQEVPQPALAAMKVKIYYGEDLFAIRVPNDILFQGLYDKICDRLKISVDQEIQMAYKDEPSGDRLGLMTNDDLDTALSRNEKLIVYVTLR